MSLTTPQAKGDALEKAVQAIEAVILSTNPATRNATITIEPKKTIMVDGVKHEIDIFITIDYGKGYTSTFIFECKNREDAVGKNDIIVFSEKIEAVPAHKGYFIAKSFGEYAVAQAKKDKRIILLTASDKLDPLPSFTKNFHLVLSNVLQTNLVVHLATDDPEIINSLTFTDESRVKVGNEELSLKALRERLQQKVIDEVINHEPTGLFTAGVYPYKKTQTVKFQHHELFILTDEIINHPDHKIGIGNEVAIAGLYANVIGEARNLPIVRMGNIAMMPEQLLPSNDFGIVEAYLIDGFVTPGMSGSPVFVLEPTYPLTANAYLLGLLHGHVEKPNPIKVPDVIITTEQNKQAEILRFQQYNIKTHLGLSYVVPAKRIWEVLNDDELVEMRNKIEQDTQ